MLLQIAALVLVISVLIDWRECALCSLAVIGWIVLA